MVAKGRPAPFKSNLSSAHDGPHVADHEESSLTARLHPPLQDPIERGQRLLETFLVLVVQTSGLEGDTADGLGNLVASAEHLVQGVRPSPSFLDLHEATSLDGSDLPSCAPAFDNWRYSVCPHLQSKTLLLVFLFDYLPILGINQIMRPSTLRRFLFQFIIDVPSVLFEDGLDVIGREISVGFLRVFPGDLPRSHFGDSWHFRRGFSRLQGEGTKHYERDQRAEAQEGNDHTGKDDEFLHTVV